MLNNLFFLLIATFILNVNAQEADPFADTTEAPAAAVETEITEESIAKSLNIAWPITDPEKSVEQINKETEELIASKLNEQYPPKTLEDFKAELEKLYPIHKVEDTVSVEYNFRGSTKTIKGQYKKLSTKSLDISGVRIPVIDIKESRLISFDMELRKKYIHRVANKKFYDFNSERDILSEKLFKMYKTSPYKKAGYVSNNGKWEKPSVVVKSTYDSKMKALAKKKAKEEAKKKKEEAKKFKLLSKSEDGEVEKIFGQDPMHVYIGAGILVVLLFGAAVMKK
ncbi:MAG: hypothetical protein MK132_10215 [Lentisphaerales bacterium]|nr:hypothetical protein [Lentisphaerales bacterium]